MSSSYTTEYKPQEILNLVFDEATSSLNVTLKSGDIQIGAVEIKNSTDDTRATVGANGLYVDVQAITFPTEYPLPTAQVTTLTPPAAITGFATSAKQLADGHSVALSATDNAVLDVIALGYGTEGDALADGILIQGDDGTDRTNVLVDIAGHLQIDVLSAPTTAVTGTFWQATQPVSGTFYQVTQPVSLASVPSHAVTNAGTFVTQENGAALTALQLIDNMISGAEAQVDVITMPTVTVNAHAVTNAGTFVTQENGAALTALQVIDNMISGSEAQVDVVAALPTGTNAIGRVGHDITGIGHGVTVVTTAGTDVVLAASTACKKVDIQAQTDNTSIIAVGGSGVDATVATGTGIVLNPGEVYSLEIDNLADIYIDSLVNGEGVRYTYWT